MQAQTLDKVLDMAWEISFDARYLELKYLGAKIKYLNANQAVIFRNEVPNRPKRILKPFIDGKLREEFDVLEYLADIPYSEKAKVVEATFEIWGANDLQSFLIRYWLPIRNPNYRKQP